MLIHPNDLLSLQQQMNRQHFSFDRSIHNLINHLNLENSKQILIILCRQPTVPRTKLPVRSRWFSWVIILQVRPPSSVDSSQTASNNNAIQATVGIDFLAKNVFLPKCIIRLQLWDTAGQERFRSLIPNYLKDAMVAILVFDVGNRSTFDNVGEWYQLFKQNKHPNASIVLVGNKIDLPRVVSKQQGVKKAEGLGMIYFETSAKAATNVQNLFTEVAKLYAADNLKESNIMENLSEKQPSTRQIPIQNIKIKEGLPYQLPQKKRKCCGV